MKSAEADQKGTRSLVSLLMGYRKEVKLYEQVLKLVRKESRVLRNGAPFAELVHLDEEKRVLFRAIDEMERRLVEPKKWFMRVHGYEDNPVLPPGAAAEYNTRPVTELLDRALALIRAIAVVETENYELLCQPATMVEMVGMR